MEVDGWRLTPYSSAGPDARALLLNVPSTLSRKSAEATVDVKLGHGFWLNLTHPAVALLAEPKQYELELSAGGNRIAHTLLELGSSADGQAQPVDVWMDGSGELGAVAVNSKAAIVGAWEWKRVDEEDSISLGAPGAPSPVLSGALVLRLFPIAGRKDGSVGGSQELAPRATSPPDDRDASRVLDDFLAARSPDQTDEGRSRRVEVDLYIQPQDAYSFRTPPSSHPLKPLRSSLRSLKPAAATFVLGYRLAPLVPPTAAMAEPVSTPHSLEEPASTAMQGHPTPPPSGRNRSAPSSASATYSRKDSKKRARGARAASVSSASDTAEASTPTQQQTFQPVTPLSRNAGKPSSAEEGKAKPSSAPGSQGQAGPSSEQASSAGSKRRKTSQTVSVAPTSSSTAGSSKGPLSTPTVARASSSGKGRGGSPTSPAARRLQREPSADPMQLVASGDEVDDEIQVVEAFSTLPPAKSLSKSQGSLPLDSQTHRRPARRTPKSSNGSTSAQLPAPLEDTHQGLLNFGDGDLFERPAGTGSLAAPEEPLPAGETDFDNLVPAPDNLFSSNERPAAAKTAEPYVSSLAAAELFDISTQEVDVESQTAGGEVLDIDYAAFFETQSGEAQAPILGPEPSPSVRVETLVSTAAGESQRSVPKPLATDVKDEMEASASAADSPPKATADGSPADGQVQESDQEPEHMEMDERDLPPLDRNIWASVREVLETAIVRGTKALTHEACKIDVDLLRRLHIDISPELFAIRDRLAQGCRSIIIAEALALLPSLSANPSEQAPAIETLPEHMSELREALHRIVFNSTVQHQAELYDRFQSVWDTSFPGNVSSIVDKQRNETVQAMRGKVAQALRAINRGM